MIWYHMIGLIYTRTCPLTCQHCITESSPSIKGRMAMEHASEYLRAIPRFSSVACFTGGEPLLFHHEIAELTSQAKRVGLVVTVVTGAGWVRGEASTRSKVRALAQAGLDGLWISWDRYHEAFARRDRAVMLARIAIDAGLRVTVRSVISANSTIDEHRQAFAGLPVCFDTSRLEKLGRAGTLPASHFFRDERLPKGGCGVVLRPVIEPDGTVYACCGPSLYARKGSPLILGNAREESLEAILSRAVQNPILEVIRNLGPYGLHQLLQDHPVGRALFKPRSSYTGMCELCLDITNHPELMAAIQERLQDADARALLTASRLWWQKRIEPQLRGRQTEPHPNGPTHEQANQS